MSTQNRAISLRDKLNNAGDELSYCSTGKTIEILEDLSDNVRLIMSKSEVECYDTLHEIDNLCYEAELRNNIDYSHEVKKIAILYEDEVGLCRG
jgi:hypothetical protein